MGLYKEVKKMYTDCSLKTTEFLDCALIGVCAVIRSNTVSNTDSNKALRKIVAYNILNFFNIISESKEDGMSCKLPLSLIFTEKYKNKSQNFVCCICD